MKRIFLALIIGVPFFFPAQVWAHSGKVTKVMEEMIKFHEALVSETSGNIDTKTIIEHLTKEADDKKDSEVFKKAIPFAEKLGRADSLKDKKKAYSLLVDRLESVVGHHDKSEANLFYCPMVKIKWIAKGEKIVNPYIKDMRDCGKIK